jgi:hypothetical protein
MSSALASREIVARLGDTWAFSIFETIALDMPTRFASSAELSPISRARARTRQPITPSSWAGAAGGTVGSRPGERSAPALPVAARGAPERR